MNNITSKGILDNQSGTAAKSSKVKSLKKALDVLEYFTVEQSEWGISELSAATGLYKSNVYNILATFESSGYVEKNSMNGKYRLGLNLLNKAHIISSYLTNFDIIHRALSELSQEIPEIVYYGILNRKDVMYIDAVIPASVYVLRSINGMTAPLYCTGLGKAMLSMSSDDLVKNIMGSPSLKRFTDTTIVDYDEMKRELAAIRARGYAIDNMEHEYGVKCVAVPLLDFRGKLNGAISVSGPSLRFTDETIMKYASLLQKKALELKESL